MLQYVWCKANVLVNMLLLLYRKCIQQSNQMILCGKPKGSSQKEIVITKKSGISY